jgi:hypothetical protein
VETALKGNEVCIKIEPIDGETQKMYGRHFDHEDLLVSRVSENPIASRNHSTNFHPRSLVNQLIFSKRTIVMKCNDPIGN